MSDTKSFEIPSWVKVLITALLPVAMVFFRKNIQKAYKWIRDRIKNWFGWTLPEITDEQIDAVIQWILDMILYEEKTRADKDTKFNNVVAKVAKSATVEQMLIIHEKWGSIPQAVNSIFLDKIKLHK